MKSLFVLIVIFTICLKTELVLSADDCRLDEMDYFAEACGAEKGISTGYQGTLKLNGEKGCCEYVGRPYYDNCDSQSECYQICRKRMGMVNAYRCERYQDPGTGKYSREHSHCHCWDCEFESTTCGVPGKPKNVRVLQTYNKRIKMAWDHTGGYYPEFYRVNIKEGDGDWTLVTNDIFPDYFSSGVTYFVEDLKRTTTYKLRVRSVSKHGQSSWVATESVTTT